MSKVKKIPIKKKVVSKSKKKVAPSKAKQKIVVSKPRVTKKEKVADGDLQHQAQRKAYELFERRGYQHGYDQFDWLTAWHFIQMRNEAQNIARLKRRKRIDENALNQEIEKKAYELFERRGWVHGGNEFDWYLARELAYLEQGVLSA